MHIPSHVEAMRAAQSLAQANHHGHKMQTEPTPPASGDDPAVVVDLSPEAMSMMAGDNAGLNPAQAARAYIEANGNPEKNFGQLVSQFARGLMGQDVQSEETPETSETIAALGEELLETVPAEETAVEETPIEETPIEETGGESPPVVEVPVVEVPEEEAPVEETVAEEAAIEPVPATETASSGDIASELLDDLLETLGDEEDEAVT